MADLRDLQASFAALYRRISERPAKGRYFRVTASGAEKTTVQLRNSLVSRFEVASDLRYEVTVAEKKSGWRTATRSFTQPAFLQNWDATVSATLSRAASSADPRPPFRDEPSLDPDAAVPDYDHDIATQRAALVFHRLYRALREVLQDGWAVDLDAQWLHGASFWDGSPREFACIDPLRFRFAPQTQIVESIRMYVPGSPFCARAMVKTTAQAADFPDFSSIVTDLAALRGAPAFAWTPAQFDHVFLSPVATEQVFRRILPQILAGEPHPALSAFLEIADAPPESAWYFDALGVRPQQVVLHAQGKTADALRADNGHAVADGARPNAFFPVLRAADAASLPAWESASATAKALGGLAVCIESVEFRRTSDGADFVLFPRGGILYHDGVAAGIVAPPTELLSLAAILGSAVPLTAPFCIGSLAVPALVIRP